MPLSYHPRHLHRREPPARPAPDTALVQLGRDAAKRQAPCAKLAGDSARSFLVGVWFQPGAIRGHAAAVGRRSGAASANPRMYDRGPVVPSCLRAPAVTPSSPVLSHPPFVERCESGSAVPFSQIGVATDPGSTRATDAFT